MSAILRAGALVVGARRDKAFEASMPGEGSHTFDGFEGAIRALATCEYCEARMIGHGVEANSRFRVPIESARPIPAV